jgi:hypothetical protein
MYLTWPYLWPNPPGHFVESVLVMSQYPWNGQVLFNGVYYSPAELPYAYLPVLFGIQFTEPVWVLALLGLAAAITGPGEKRELALLTFVWFAIPLIGFIVTRSPLYDNFRQIFFIVPPVFILAGVMIERIRDARWRDLIFIVCLLPGMVNALKLHPYEYIYYNQFIGGVSGAFRRYELDYWGISYREAADHINLLAPEGATVWVSGPSHIFELYARDDLKVYSDYETDRADHYDCIVTTTRYNLDLETFPDAPIIYWVARDDAWLTVIKEPIKGLCKPDRGL